ncbi:hypothetical protein DAI22_11g130100 [Oryza sativa Japonica Group]|nr:hypothetical protein DAI22_11g130100 [Oryza sativa Japonica Group]
MGAIIVVIDSFNLHQFDFCSSSWTLPINLMQVLVQQFQNKITDSSKKNKMLPTHCHGTSSPKHATTPCTELSARSTIRNLPCR